MALRSTTSREPIGVLEYAKDLHVELTVGRLVLWLAQGDAPQDGLG